MKVRKEVHVEKEERMEQNQNRNREGLQLHGSGQPTAYVNQGQGMPGAGFQPGYPAPVPGLTGADIMEINRKKEAEEKKGAALFGKLALASLIYTLVYTFCIYKNTSGVTMPLWVGTAVGYVCYTLKLFEKKQKRDSLFIIIVLCLTGISTFLTGNEWIILMNYIAVFLLIASLLLHNFAEDKSWDFGTYFWEIIVAVFGAVGMIAKPFTDGSAFLKSRKKKKDGKGRYIAAGILLAIPCLLILGALLASADMVFAHLIDRMFAGFAIPSRIFGIGFMLCFGFFSSYCGVRYVESHADKITVTDKRNGEPLIAITVTAMIAFLYLVFSVIQIAGLFAGKLRLPDGVTYAEYARTGFFQLLFVCMINLMLVLAVKKYFRENKALDRILLVISGCTYIMTASSACRMLLYIEAYQLTFLRVSVLAALFTIALLMAGVIAMIFKPGFSFFRYGFAVVSIVYVIFAFSHIDALIASYNLSQVEKTGETTDYRYIARLSTDAAPVIAAYVKEHPQSLETEPYTRSGMNWYEVYLYRNQGAMSEIHLRNFNVSHFIAAKVLETY